MLIYLSLSAPPNRSFSSTHKNALNCSLAYVLFHLKLSPLTYKSAYLLDCDLFEVRGYERGIITVPLTWSPLCFAHCRCKNNVLVE